MARIWAGPEPARPSQGCAGGSLDAYLVVEGEGLAALWEAPGNESQGAGSPGMMQCSGLKVVRA